MYGSKAAFCSAGVCSFSAGGQLPSLPGPASSYLVLPGTLSSFSSTSHPHSATSFTSPPSSRMKSFNPCQLSLHGSCVLALRSPALAQTCLLSAPVLSSRGRQDGCPRVLTSRQRNLLSVPLAGRQFCVQRAGGLVFRVLNADADRVGEDELPAEVHRRSENEERSNASVQREQQLQKGKQLKNRIMFGVGIGAGFLGIVLAGGWVFTLAFACVIWVATGEYFELVRSKGNIASGMTPPPPVAAKVCAAICSAMPIMTLYYGGRMGAVVTTAAFALATVLLLQRGPRFSQLTSAIFGLFYCGYLPSFWIKLRCGLAVPALNTPGIAESWPLLLGGQAHWTVGLVATIISCSAIAAADTFSFLGGKAFGKTPLIAVSPKKTLEGAAVGLSSTIAVTILLSKLFQWPSSIFSSAVLAVLVFVSSLFGDLTESMMKRDAGVKDSGQLIPGHGGILDRVDSYVFTGALVYSFVKIGLPLFGV